MNFNLQPIEKPVDRPDGALDVVSIFKTIQGEGPLAGTPAIFVRLAGCNLSGPTCPWCDTDYTTGRKIMTPEGILKRAAELVAGDKINLIVLTGGEPYRQGLKPFVWEALNDGTYKPWRVQIETNGTLWQELAYWDYHLSIVCSPKTGTVNEKLASQVTAWKYVLQAGAVDNDGLPSSVLGNGVRVARPSSFCNDVYVQPMDEQDPVKNQANADAAVASCMKFGYRLSVQTHKILNLP